MQPGWGQQSDDYLRPGTESITGGSTVTTTYDNDSFVTGVSSTSPSFSASLAARSNQSGRLNQMTVGSLTTAYGYGQIPNYGDLLTITTTHSGSAKFAETLVYGELGLITSRTDSIAGVNQPARTYEYDGSSRLWKRTVSGVTTTYGYDARSNPTTINGATVAVYNISDQLQSFTGVSPTVTYTYTYASGTRKTRTQNSQTTTYTHDPEENLLQVDLPGNVVITHEVDGLNRRVTRKKTVSGSPVSEKRYLYADGHQLIAELNSSGTVVSQFIYARGTHVPDILIKGSTVYQLVSDHLGSVRLVVQMSNGAVAQRIDYDEWGTPTYVTGTADFQPFAFAGGLWDPDTKLLKLGARDYDPEVRQFITRDPSLFAGGWNLYAYAGGDPVNYVDPDGHAPWLVAAAAGAAAGAGIDIATQLATNGGNFDCINWGSVGVSAALGALPGTTKGLNWRRLLADQRGSLGGGAGLTASEVARIQNAANRLGRPIHLVGSRAKGTAKPGSDWDYVIEGLNSRGWSKVKNSLPGAPNREEGVARSIDLFKGPLNPNLPHVSFWPMP